MEVPDASGDFAPQICFVVVGRFVKSYHNNQRNRTEGLCCHDSGQRLALQEFEFTSIKNHVKACLKKLLLTVRTRLCGEFKYIVHKHIQQAANGTGLAADQARSKTNIVHVSVFVGHNSCFKWQNRTLDIIWQYTKTIQKVDA